MTGDRPPASAMILAAGLGTRMRPHSLDIPKVLVPVKGRPIIDYTVERLAQAGVKHAVVNAHHHADQLISHLAHLAPEAHLAPVGTPGSDCSAPVISISDERAELLDTGGGFAKALPILGDDPFYGLNGDVIWLDGVFNTLHRLTKRWDPDLMDALLLVVLCPRAVGYDGRGDFMMDGNGLIRRRREVEVAPYVYSGVQLLHPEGEGFGCSPAVRTVRFHSTSFMTGQSVPSDCMDCVTTVCGCTLARPTDSGPRKPRLLLYSDSCGFIDERYERPRNGLQYSIR